MIFRKRIAIDLGTANTLVWVAGAGLVANEPTVVAISSDESKVVAVGEDAKKMLGRTPEALIASRPLREGVIADYQITEAMLRYFIGKAMNTNISKGSKNTRNSFDLDKKGNETKRRFNLGFGRNLKLVKPDVMVCVPAGCTQVERRAALDATLSAGAAKAYLIDEPLAAAIGAGIPVSAPSGHMILDIGGGSSESAVISLGGVVVHKSVRVGGNKLDEAIQDYMKKKYNLVVGDQTAEEIKIKIGTALPPKEEIKMEVSGRDLIFGLPRSIQVTNAEINEALSDTLNHIVGVVKGVLEDTPPELAADIIDKGIVMSGGTSTLHNFDKLITKETGVPAHVAEDALFCVVRGTGVVLENIDLWRRSVTIKR